MVDIKEMGNINKTYKNISHVSDIHIRLVSRHKEYRSVFDRYVESIKEKNIDLVVITGDLFHSKVNLSPEAYDLATYFFDNVLKHSDVVLIPGNHDANLESKGNRLDAISPFINLYNRESDMSDRLFYLRESGVYDIGNNLRFFHYSVLDEQEPDVEMINTDEKYNIALFHGMIGGAVDDTGITYTETEREIPFKKYDVVMLGDIHKHQQLNDNTWYAGSLIQQKTSEDSLQHGYIHWACENSEPNGKLIPKFVRIKNDWGFYTIHFRNGAIVTDYNDIPENASIYVVVSQVDSKQDAIEKCREKYPKNNIYPIPEKVDQEGRDVVFQKNVIDLYDYSVNAKLVEEHLNDVPEKLKEDVIAIHNVTFKGNISKTDQRGFKPNYKVNKIEFSNTLPFGEDNVFDLRKYKGVVGLFSGNGMGKSSLADIFTGAKFGKYPNMTKQQSFINNNKKSFSTIAEIEQDGYVYELKRRGTRTKTGVNNKIEFTRSKNGKVENLGDDIPEINKQIQDKFGDLDTFIQLSYFKQRQTDSFLDLTPAKRQEWFSTNVGLEVFDILHESAKKDSKELRDEVKILEKTDYKKKELDILEAQGSVRSKGKKWSQELKQEKNKQQKLLNEKSKLEALNVDRSLCDQSDTIQKLNGEIENVDIKISSVMNQNLEEDTTLVSYRDKVTQLNSEIDRVNSWDIEEMISEESIELKRQIDEIVTEGKTIADEIEKIKKSIEDIPDQSDFIAKYEKLIKDKNDLNVQLEKLDRQDQNLKEKLHSKEVDYESSKREYLCEVCPLLVKAKEIESDITKIREEIKANTNEYKKIKGEIDSFEDIEDKLNNTKELQKKHDDLKLSLSQKESERKTLLGRHKIIKEQLSSVSDKIKENQKQKVESLNDNIKEYEELYESRLNDLKQNKTDKLESLKSKKENIEFKLNSTKQLHKKWEEQKDLIEKVSKIDDLEVEIKTLQKSIDEIQEEINNNNADVKYYDRLLDENERDRKKLVNKQEEVKAYEKYIQLTHRSGLPLSVIKKLISIFESEVNFVLEKVVESRAHIYIEENNIHVDIEDFRGKRSADRLGGTESFVFNLAFRIAIAEIGNLPMSNIMIIDEHFSVLDDNNSQNIPDLFAYLRSKYDTILVISHDTDMRDFVDSTIDIELDGMDSKLVA